jgi:Holliday junction resolvase RusA-like endonuclease
MIVGNARHGRTYLMGEKEGVQWYQLHVNPEPWAVGPLSIGRRNGHPTATMGRNQQLDAYKAAIREELESEYSSSVTRIFLPYYSIDFFFYRHRAEYTTPNERQHRKHEADLTNLQKATEDALQGILFENDRDVVRVCSWYVEQSPQVEFPGVVVRFRWGVPRDEVLTMLPGSIYDELQGHRHLSVVREPATEGDDNAWPPR